MVDLVGFNDHFHHLFTQNTPKTRKDVCYLAITFTNLNELKMYIQAQINSTLKEEVVDEITGIATTMAYNNVYGAYYNKYTHEPNMYVRRYGSGGLVDPDNFQGTMPESGVIEVRNITEPDGGGFNLSELIEYGDGNGGDGAKYHYGKGVNTVGDFHDPRPFMGPTQEELAKGNTLKNIIKEGLKRRGLTVK